MGREAVLWTFVDPRCGWRRTCTTMLGWRARGKCSNGCSARFRARSTSFLLVPSGGFPCFVCVDHCFDRCNGAVDLGQTGVVRFEDREDTVELVLHSLQLRVGVLPVR